MKGREESSRSCASSLLSGRREGRREGETCSLPSFCFIFFSKVSSILFSCLFRLGERDFEDLEVEGEEDNVDNEIEVSSCHSFLSMFIYTRLDRKGETLFCPEGESSEMSAKEREELEVEKEEEEEEEEEEDLSSVTKPTPPKVDNVKRKHSSGPRVQDPYSVSDNSSYIIPVVAAIAAFIPLLYCLCKI